MMQIVLLYLKIHWKRYKRIYINRKINGKNNLDFIPCVGRGKLKGKETCSKNLNQTHNFTSRCPQSLLSTLWETRQ